MDEGGTGATEVLDAEEHFVLLGGGGHEHGLALAFAGFESDPCIAEVSGQEERFEIG